MPFFSRGHWASETKSVWLGMGGFVVVCEGTLLRLFCKGGQKPTTFLGGGGAQLATKWTADIAVAFSVHSF